MSIVRFPWQASTPFEIREVSNGGSVVSITGDQEQLETYAEAGAFMSGISTIGSETSGLSAIEFPVGLNKILVRAAADGNGEKAPMATAEHFDQKGCVVRIFQPLVSFKHFTYELRGIAA